MLPRPPTIPNTRHFLSMTSTEPQTVQTAAVPPTQPQSEDPYSWRPTDWAEEESPKDKLFRKLKEQPLVPAGCLLTCGALGMASYHLRRGNAQSMNRALRWRIYFQGLTVAAAVVGLYYFEPNAAAPPPSLPAESKVYQNITTAPGRPPTNSQVTKESLRQATNRKEWEDRFRAAQKHDEGLQDQRLLEQALLKGVDVEQVIGGDGEQDRKKDIEERRRNRPVVGQDGRDRRSA